MQKITPFLWFDNQAEEAVNFYISVFKNSKILDISYYGDVGGEISGFKKGDVLTIAFQLDGQNFTALNGGKHYKINEGISFVVSCDSQEEVDYYWEKLTDGGEESQCGWLKDKFGVSWQVVPAVLGELMNSPDADKSRRVMEALLQMRKLDIPALEKAYRG